MCENGNTLRFEAGISRPGEGLRAGFTAVSLTGVLDHVGLANADIGCSERLHDQVTDRAAIFQGSLFKLVDDVLGQLDSDAPPFLARGWLFFGEFAPPQRAGGGSRGLPGAVTCRGRRPVLLKVPSLRKGGWGREGVSKLVSRWPVKRGSAAGLARLGLTI